MVRLLILVAAASAFESPLASGAGSCSGLADLEAWLCNATFDIGDVSLSDSITLHQVTLRLEPNATVDIGDVSLSDSITLQVTLRLEPPNSA